jgi:hypothetical protein
MEWLAVRIPVMKSFLHLMEKSSQVATRLMYSRKEKDLVFKRAQDYDLVCLTHNDTTCKYVLVEPKSTYHFNDGSEIQTFSSMLVERW